MERVIRSLGLSKKNEVLLKEDEIMKAMDGGSELLIYVWGKQGNEVFFEKMKKLKRSRKTWGLEVVRKGNHLELKELPIRDPTRHGIYGIFDEDGVAIILSEKKPEAEEVEEEKELEELLQDKLGDPRRQSEDFWRGQGRSPTLPSTRIGDWMKTLCESEIREDSVVCPLVLRGLAKPTRQAHHRVIRWLISMAPVPPEQQAMSISSWILLKCEERREDRHWKGSTLATTLATAQGALANLPVYREEVQPVLLKLCPEWRLGMRGAGIMSKGTLPEQALVATQAIILEAIRLEPLAGVKAALEMGWVTAGRGGDVVKLRTKDILLLDKGTRVRFVIGKTATSQPYTVSTAALSSQGQLYVEARRKEGGEKGWLFPGVTGEQIKKSLRRVDERLEQRSMRRGALQFLASTGMSDIQLMEYSQHRSIHTLRRYLEFGWLSGEGPGRAERAGGLELRE